MSREVRTDPNAVHREIAEAVAVRQRLALSLRFPIHRLKALASKVPVYDHDRYYAEMDLLEELYDLCVKRTSSR